MNWLKGRKTFIVSGLLVAVSILQVVVGDLSFMEFIKSPALLDLLVGLGFTTLKLGQINK